MIKALGMALLFTVFKEEFELPPNQLLSFGNDGPNVNTTLRLNPKFTSYCP